MDSVVSHFGARLTKWVVKRRIKLSLLAFTMLVTFNLVVMQTHPHDPLDIKNPIVAVSIVSLLVGVLLRSWSAGTLRKSQELTTVGPYALVRNPLYLGSFMMMLGFCVLMRDTFSLLFIAGPMSFLYGLQIKAEEENLSQWFPDEWKRYVRSTPRIVPRIGVKQLRARWSLKQWIKNREYNAIVASLLGVLALWCHSYLS